MYVIIQIPSGEYAVGFYDPDRVFHSISCHLTLPRAERKVHYLHGGDYPYEYKEDK